MYLEMEIKLKPIFDTELILDHVNELKKIDAISHSQILGDLLDEFEPLDFVALAFPEVVELRNRLEGIPPDSKEAEKLRDQIKSFKLTTKHYLIISIENLLDFAHKNRWGLCKNNDFIYLYNSSFWDEVDKEKFQKFLGEASEKMGVKKFDARYYQFREQLFKQFLATAYLPTPDINKETVLINLKNGTFEISPQGTQLRPFDRSDFLTYQLPFEYDPLATAPMFDKYLNRVIPDPERQNVLAEFMGYIFIKHGSKTLKEEKALILYGTGANGKSVFFEIVNALLGNENVSSFSLQSLTNDNGYFRAKLGNKLVNYASEINGNLEASIFKQLVSGEPVEARLPYGNPFMLRQYSKLIFNCNELPKDVEHTNAYFRRFLIIPFDVTIPEAEQDKNLHTKIIENELSGVFNWVLKGLNRLLDQKKFSDCEAARAALEQYKIESNSIKLFLDENGYKPSSSNWILIKDIYPLYKGYCLEDGMKPFNKRNFIKQLQGLGIVIERNMYGNIAYLDQSR